MKGTAADQLPAANDAYPLLVLLISYPLLLIGGSYKQCLIRRICRHAQNTLGEQGG